LLDERGEGVEAFVSERVETIDDVIDGGKGNVGINEVQE
jgi:hypothetical protein